MSETHTRKQVLALVVCIQAATSFSLSPSQLAQWMLISPHLYFVLARSTLVWPLQAAAAHVRAGKICRKVSACAAQMAYVFMKDLVSATICTSQAQLARTCLYRWLKSV